MIIEVSSTSVEGQFSLGVDLGGTNLRVAVYRSGKQVTELISLPTRLSQGRERVIHDLKDAVVSLRSKFRAHGELVGIGVGSPGPLELPAGIIRNPPNLPGWDGFQLRAAIEEAIGEPILLDSDANAAALAEFELGSARAAGIHSLCMLTLGTGVGNGIILDDRIWHGNNGMAGEAGHLMVEPDGMACPCGGRGCVELYASATGVVRMAKEVNDPILAAMLPRDPAEWTSHAIADAAIAGNVTATAIFQRVGRAIGIAFGGVANMLNLPLYVVAGGLSNAWDLFAPAMFAEMRLRSYVYRPTAAAPGDLLDTPGKSFVRRAELGSDAGILGACLLPFAHDEEALGRSIAQPTEAS
jgi:glucokinase